MANTTLREHTRKQLLRLCRIAGLPGPHQLPVELLDRLLGAAGESRLDESSPWPSDISDDTTPVEFSIAFSASGKCTVRVLGETVNTYHERQFLDAVAGRLRLFTGRFDAVQDLFLPDEHKGGFRLWYSLIFRPASAPRVKIYLNPQVAGPARAGRLVAEGLRRLGIDHAYDAVVASALTRGELDRFSFFALDLDDGPQSRVKLYISHEAAGTEDVVRTARLVPGVNAAQIHEFCALLGGGNDPFRGRPLISSYSFVSGDNTRPSTYSLYLPIRDYVPDDEVARARVLAVMTQYDIDSVILDRALGAVSSRPLREGVGLIPHVSLRLGIHGSGITVYLASEAYSAAPPRRRTALGLASSV